MAYNKVMRIREIMMMRRRRNDLYFQEALALVVDVGIGMSQAAPGFDSPLQIASDILQMIVQRKVGNRIELIV